MLLSDPLSQTLISDAPHAHVHERLPELLFFALHNQVAQPIRTREDLH